MLFFKVMLASCWKEILSHEINLWKSLVRAKVIIFGQSRRLSLQHLCSKLRPSLIILVRFKHFVLLVA